MEFAWCEFAEEGESGCVYAKTMNRLKLFPQESGGEVKFNGDAPGGHWTYELASNATICSLDQSCLPLVSFASRQWREFRRVYKEQEKRCVAGAVCPLVMPVFAFL